MQQPCSGRVPNLDSDLSELLPDVRQAADEAQVAQIFRCDHALSTGDYADAIAAVLDWNRAVMASRGSAPWVALNRGTLDVRYRGIESRLPSGDELTQVWRNSYFLDALKDVTFQLEEDANGEQ